MRLKSLQISDYRNIEEARFVPDAQTTVIAGDNGQGKTNLLESIWLLTGSKSFRGSKDMDLVRRGALFGRIEGEVFDGEQQKKIEILVAGSESGKRGRSAKVNGVPYGRATSIAGVFTAVVFEPGHLSLVKGGPEGRRRFIDAALCQLYPGYIATLRRFSRALTQKNSLLKMASYVADANELLDSFDEEMAMTGEEISKRRKEYLMTAGPLAQRIYEELSSGAEQLSFFFCPAAAPGELRNLLLKSRPADMRAGFCTVGPQREDFEVFINETSARVYGSQGQQRSVVLSLKLAEAACAKEITGRHPVMLLDDVLSELDEGRKRYLLSRMEGKQTFVTTCDTAAFKQTDGRIFYVKEGRLLPEGTG